MSHLQQAIGIFGGTFDPIHFGHLRTALELYQALNLAEIRFVPCYQPVHREQPEASPLDRFNMVRCAIQGESAFTLDDCEIARKGPSYMADTLETLNKKRPNTPLCLIMGIDALLTLTSWHRYTDILALANLVVAHRPSYHLPETGIIADLLKQHLKHNPSIIHESMAGNIILHPVTPLDISATDIRKQIAMDKNPRYLLPDPVYQYIKKQGVYSMNHL